MIVCKIIIRICICLFRVCGILCFVLFWGCCFFIFFKVKDQGVQLKSQLAHAESCCSISDPWTSCHWQVYFTPDEFFCLMNFFVCMCPCHFVFALLDQWSIIQHAMVSLSPTLHHLFSHSFFFFPLNPFTVDTFSHSLIHFIFHLLSVQSVISAVIHSVTQNLLSLSLSPSLPPSPSLSLSLCLSLSLVRKCLSLYGFSHVLFFTVIQIKDHRL